MFLPHILLHSVTPCIFVALSYLGWNDYRKNVWIAERFYIWPHTKELVLALLKQLTKEKLTVNET